MPNAAPDPQHAAQAFWRLCQHSESAALATVDAKGMPHASHVPYLCQDGVFYLFTSQLSAHTAHLLQTRHASLLICDPDKAVSVFARPRAQLHCRVEVIERGQAAFDTRLDAMTERLGDTVGLLRTLADFVLFALHPERGLWIEGFGRAFELSGADLDQVTHLDAERLRARGDGQN